MPDTALLIREHSHICVNPEFLLRAIKFCQKNGFSFVFMHSHPYDTAVPSRADEIAEEGIMRKVLERIPNSFHATIIIGMRCIWGRIWLDTPLRWVPLDHVYITDDRSDTILYELHCIDHQFKYA